MEYVIIGNSTAAVGCIEGIRSVDPEGAITVVASEPYHTYSRPLISYLLEGKTDGERMKYRPDSYYNEMAVKPKLGIKAVKLMPEEHKVVLEDGEELPYGKLLVATGSTPFVPSFEGLDTVEKKFTFLSLDDAKALEAALTPESRVLILGAGLIGLKCAEGIARRVKSIEVADLASQVLPSILDEAGAKRVQARLEGQGLTFHLGDTAVKFQGNTAHLKSGGTVDFDVLVLAVGVRPNGSLVREAGGKVDRGILTDDTGLTSLPDVYAAGDCCESYDITSGERRVLALLPPGGVRREEYGGGKLPLHQRRAHERHRFFWPAPDYCRQLPGRKAGRSGWGQLQGLLCGERAFEGVYPDRGLPGERRGLHGAHPGADAPFHGGLWPAAGKAPVYGLSGLEAARAVRALKGK